jgi:hypothetical protein
VARPGAESARVEPASVDAWLGELGLTVLERAERDGVSSWDLELDGLRRGGIRVTIILDPARAMLLWVHFAPPLNDSFRVSYRQLLRWNDELPFVKFGLGAEEQLVLTAELAARTLDRDEVGRALCRLLAVCDLTLERARPWLTLGTARAPDLAGPSRQAGLFARYGAEATELLALAADEESEAGDARS